MALCFYLFFLMAFLLFFFFGSLIVCIYCVPVHLLWLPLSSQAGLWSVSTQDCFHTSFAPFLMISEKLVFETFFFDEQASGVMWWSFSDVNFSLTLGWMLFFTKLHILLSWMCLEYRQVNALKVSGKCESSNWMSDMQINKTMGAFSTKLSWNVCILCKV